MPEIELDGCTPEPLMCYLKALGVLRLFSEQDSEQKDPKARGYWKNDVFVLCSNTLPGDAHGNRQALMDFFLNQYQPTPIIGAWAGGSGFFLGDNDDAVNALSAASSKRCSEYARAIQLVKNILQQEGITNKPTEAQKNLLLQRYRSELPDDALQWVDCAWVLQSDEQIPSPLLGTGGNDGRLDFSRNFMERLIVLGLQNSTPDPSAGPWLENALFHTPVSGLKKAAVGQFAPGRVGGPNATQGTEGASTDNPWDFVLMMEGVLVLAGCATRRLGVGEDRKAAFPFTVRPTAVGYFSTTDVDSQSETGRGELWLPLWSRPASLLELQTLVSEGRAEVRGRPARDATDFARAATSLGVDRGIEEFARISFLKRSGKAFLATPLGRMPVCQRESGELLPQLDAWLDRFRTACRQKDIPPRFAKAVRRIEAAIFEFCRYGGPIFSQGVLIALGAAERELSLSAGKVGKSTIPPIANLSAGWIDASNDGSPEFEIALALAGTYDPDYLVGSLRSNLEPVKAWRKGDGPIAVHWIDKDRTVVWNSGELDANLAAVLDRRLMDSRRRGCVSLPLASTYFVSLETVSRFVARELDDRRIEDLLWGLVLADTNTKTTLPRRHSTDADAPPLPRAYALLKLLFLSQSSGIGCRGALIKPEPAILPLLTTGHIGQACRFTMHALRASGLSPLPHPCSGGILRDGDWREIDRSDIDGGRLAAALLLPLSHDSIDELQSLVVRGAVT